MKFFKRGQPEAVPNPETPIDTDKVEAGLSRVAVSSQAHVEIPVETPARNLHGEAQERVTKIVSNYEAFCDDAYESGTPSRNLPRLTAEAINDGNLPSVMRDPQIGTMSRQVLVTFDGKVPSSAFEARYFTLDGDETPDGGSSGDNYGETELRLSSDAYAMLRDESGGWRYGQTVQLNDECTIGLTEQFSVAAIHSDVPTASEELLADLDSRIL